MLIASRALLGIAGATIAPSTLSLIRNMFHDAQPAHGRDRRLDHRVSRSAARSARCSAERCSSSSGGARSSSSPCRSWLCCSSWARCCCRSTAIPTPGRLDLLSAAHLAGRRAGGRLRPQADRPGRPRVAAAGRAPSWSALVVGIAFVRRQTMLADPLIDLRLFRVPAFSASLAVYTLGILVLFGAFLFIFQYLQLVAGLSPFRAGLWTLPSFGAFIVGSMLAPVIVRRVPLSVRDGWRARNRRRRLRAAHAGRARTPDSPYSWPRRSSSRWASHRCSR